MELNTKTIQLLRQLQKHTKSSDIGVRELARRTDSDGSHVSKILRTKHSPNLDFMVKLCTAAGLEIQLTETKKK